MSRKETKAPRKLDLEALAGSIEQLIALCERLSEENSRLRSQRTRLLNERTALAQRNDQSRNKLEAMISRLRSLEVEL